MRHGVIAEQSSYEPESSSGLAQRRTCTLVPVGQDKIAGGIENKAELNGQEDQNIDKVPIWRDAVLAYVLNEVLMPMRHAPRQLDEELRHDWGLNYIDKAAMRKSMSNTAQTLPVSMIFASSERLQSRVTQHKKAHGVVVFGSVPAVRIDNS